MKGQQMIKFYEFFAGGGMARAGLGEGWSCLFANDIDHKKGASYAANWGRDHLKIADIASLNAADLPSGAALAWASFPCQDLSLAGAGAGLKGERSGTFWPFWSLMTALGEQDKAPPVIVLENVCGALSSHGGKDFAAIGDALTTGGYRFGALVVDATYFVPQSRPRLFIIAVREGLQAPSPLIAAGACEPWHTAALVGAYEKLSKCAKASWVWWRLPQPAKRKTVFSDLIEENPKGVKWHAPEETAYLLSLMSAVNLRKVDTAKKMGRRMVGTIYRRTRRDESGRRVQRAEVRFDDIAGCLRTPVGGSSRQSIMIVDRQSVRSRLLSPREAARLMGLPDSYELPSNYNEAYHLAGDGVVVPVVRHLAAHILEPILAAQPKDARAAA
jgi:DNA (cytosine-5)-methyltransferase 1